MNAGPGRKLPGLGYSRRYSTDARPSRSAAMTDAGTAATAAAVTMMLGLAAASWVVAIRQMNAMDMGVAG